LGYWLKYAFLSFPNTGGSSFSTATVSTTVHSRKALEQHGSESFYLLEIIYNYFLISVKKIKKLGIKDLGAINPF